ncbi:MAG: hypothetical protein QM667_01485 [Asticcacaulis sp.]
MNSITRMALALPVLLMVSGCDARGLWFKHHVQNLASEHFARNGTTQFPLLKARGETVCGEIRVKKPDGTIVYSDEFLWHRNAGLSFRKKLNEKYKDERLLQGVEKVWVQNYKICKNYGS